MNTLTPYEVTGFKKAQTDTLNSTCVIKTLSVTFDELGDAINSFSNSALIPCGVKQDADKKATFRFNSGLAIKAGDLVSLSTILGESSTLVYQIIEVKKTGIAIQAIGVLYE